jgi:hypothetical protein
VRPSGLQCRALLTLPPAWLLSTFKLGDTLRNFGGSLPNSLNYNQDDETLHSLVEKSKESRYPATNNNIAHRTRIMSFFKPYMKLTLHCNHRSGHLKTEHTESLRLLRRHFRNRSRDPLVSMRSELLIAYEKLRQFQLLTVYVVSVYAWTRTSMAADVVKWIQEPTR